MDFKKWLIQEKRGEYSPNNTIVVDVQPEYVNYIGFNIGEFANFLSQMLTKGRKVLYFYNGDSVGSSNNADSIKRWLASALIGAELEAFEWYDEEDDPYTAASELIKTFQNIYFYDKGYAFFRGWMDQGVEDYKIIKVIRAMVMNRIYDSRELPDDLLTQLVGDDMPQCDNIYLPHIDLLQLRSFNGAFLCGGGENECLKEVQLLMNALNIKYKVMSKFVF